MPTKVLITDFQRLELGKFEGVCTPPPTLDWQATFDSKWKWRLKNGSYAAAIDEVRSRTFTSSTFRVETSRLPSIDVIDIEPFVHEVVNLTNDA